MKKERFIVVDVTLFFLLIQTVVIRMGLALGFAAFTKA